MDVLEKEILLSVVVPVYNVERYLSECLDSIMEQITDECEIILIDDGSTDMSGQICDRYGSKNKRIVIIHQENRGLSAARNEGLMIAKGRYVLFVDSDDRVALNSIFHILNWIKISDADLCFLQAIKFYQDGVEENFGECIFQKYLKGKNRKEAIRFLSSRPKFPGSACTKAYKKEFLIDNNLFFPKDRRYSEDLGFVRDCILCAKKFDALDVPFYEYRQNRKDSITNKISEKNFVDLYKFLDESISILTTNKKENDVISRYVMRFVAYEYVILLYLYNYIPKEFKKDALVCLKNTKWTLKFSHGYKAKLILYLLYVIGIKNTAILLGKYKDINIKKVT